jgi:hypothetical protein
MIHDWIESKQVCEAGATNRLIWSIAEWGCDEYRLVVRNIILGLIREKREAELRSPMRKMTLE